MKLAFAWLIILEINSIEFNLVSKLKKQKIKSILSMLLQRELNVCTIYTFSNNNIYTPRNTLSNNKQ